MRVCNPRTDRNVAAPLADGAWDVDGGICGNAGHLKPSWSMVASVFPSSFLIPSTNISFGSNSITPINVLSSTSIPSVNIEISCVLYAKINLSSNAAKSLRFSFNIFVSISFTFFVKIPEIYSNFSKMFVGIIDKVLFTNLTNSPE